MIHRLLKEKSRKKISMMLLTIMLLDIITPTISSALTSGPVQPEAQSFEPVGTTDLVDMFTGDFVYNIPLMDVEGYPINISYHGGVTMEQEASWVGLGWNITPGAVNRAIRGLPDDFAGDSLEKELNLKPDINKRIGLSGNVELAGLSDPYLKVGVDLGGYVNISNYKGVSVDFTSSAGINTKLGPITAGVNIGASVGSQTGAAIDYGANIGIGISRRVSGDLSAGGAFNLNTGGNYSPRTGLKRNSGWSATLSGGTSKAGGSFSTGQNVQIGLMNHTAVVTNAAYMNSYSGQLKLGGEIYSVYLNGRVSGSMSKTEFAPDGSRKGYGYFHLDQANENDILDFSRDRDGNYNTTMKYLPQSHITYDVYNVNGQGTGGSFRPFRNDIGSVYDPVTSSKQNTQDYNLEVGLGNLFEIGGEFQKTETNTESGPWDDFKRPYVPDSTGSYEAVYFKEAGELTENNETYLNGIGNTTALMPLDLANIPLTKPDAGKRITRANHIYTLTGSDKDTAALLDSKQLISYTDSTGFKNYPNINKTIIARVDASSAQKLKRNPQQVTEIVQIQKDGRRYVYGLPTLNNVQREVTFAVDPNKELDKDKYLIGYTQGIDDSRSNTNGLDHFYSSTVTPAYVSTHLLTGVLSADYSDVTGDGITDDDLGSYTKFNYTRKSADYRWRSPVESGKAQYVPGYVTDKKDDKASYIIGSREQWMLHSVETRNYVAEFYVSQRQDALGVLDKILSGQGPVYNDAKYTGSGSAADNKSYKLDSIVLYNKHDRFLNGANAQPVKTVLLSYDDSLCHKVPNAVPGSGKLTLRKIQIRYGSSNINMSAAYTFNYSSNNPDYNIAAKDRWGSYKPNTGQMNNYEFPFTEQSAATDNYVNAWSLTEIGLPSGGVIKVDYESDDYAYVQDKEAMEMFKVVGMGNSPAFDDGNQLYFSTAQSNLYFYFNRRTASENNNISFKDNYFKNQNILYFNIPTELADGKFEPIKGYGEIEAVGACPDGTHGYVKFKARRLSGTNTDVNPVVFTALNTGRYSLPHVIFPGANPESDDMSNVVAGLKYSIKELFNLQKNPLKYMMEQGKAQDADLAKAFIRLTSPGLKKKGGGQRVKSVRFYDNWNAMAGGNNATYGKQYFYTMDREDGKGVISSGVASYEPLAGGDEIPQRLPVVNTVQSGTLFPPNDPIELYQEEPIGESFFPGPVVGYRKVTVRSINIDSGRSSQSEDIHGFYTAKDFPIQVSSQTKKDDLHKDWSLKDMLLEQSAMQGFSIVLNDMHGKQRNTEHWVLKPASGQTSRELINYQKYEYLTQNGQLNNMVPAFDYNAGAGQLNVTNKKMGVETDITLDSRRRYETTKTFNVSGNANGFLVLFASIVIPLGYPFTFENKLNFKTATVTKVTQQYGVLSKVTNYNEGAITEVHNEVFDPQTGNALVTSVNNEFNDRQYSVSYPAYWAYKELGPSYENHDLKGSFDHPLIIDQFGSYAARFVNYNNAYSYHYDLPVDMPIARTIVDENMPKYKLGDELLLQTSPSMQPLRVWVMGYTSDLSHCYLVLAKREPYRQDAFWTVGNNYNNVSYRVVRSGNRNRLGEVIQSYTTTDSTNIFPYLKNDLTNLISLSAQRYNHNLDQVYAANKISDSLNPFVTGKVGMYRPEMEIVNLKNRQYVGAGMRAAGTFGTPAYWKTEKDNFPSYCPDSLINADAGNVGPCLDAIQQLSFSYQGNDKLQVNYLPFIQNPQSCTQSKFTFWNPLFSNGGTPNPPATPAYVGYTYIFNNQPSGFVYRDSLFFEGLSPLYVKYENGCCAAMFSVKWNASTNSFTIARLYYRLPGGTTPATYTNVYNNSPALIFDPSGSGAQYPTPFRVRKKIMLGKVGHYDGTDFENWIKTRQATKYNWYGAELENKEEGIGYNSAVYGYNQQMPVCVAKNARSGEVLFDGFEDYALLQPIPSANESYTSLMYSPISAFLQSYNAVNSLYKKSTLNGGTFNIVTDDTHTGIYALKAISNSLIPLNALSMGMSDGYSFKMTGNRKYVASVWLKPASVANNVALQGYTGDVSIIMDTTLAGLSANAVTMALAPKSDIIEGWQKFEVTFDAPAAMKNFVLKLGAGFYYDDLRVYPFESNSKGFVYEPVTRKLMATLDENNYATFYEYDAEGNLVRTKKETEKGILTISESRSTHRKSN
jgi:hypothetical protein